MTALEQLREARRWIRIFDIPHNDLGSRQRAWNMWHEAVSRFHREQMGLSSLEGE